MPRYDANKKKIVDFQYSLNYDYHTERHCDSHGCDSICRCSTIEGFEISSIKWDSIIWALDNFLHPETWSAPKKKSLPMPEDIYKYGLDRIARYHRLYELSSYHADIQHSYYGEEVDNITHKNNDALVKSLEEFLASTNPVEYLLNMEYSQVLPAYKDLDWAIVEVDYADIKAGSKNQTEMVKREPNNPYSQYDGVLGVCVPSGGKLKLIDGYHRHEAMADIPKVKVLVGSKRK